MPEFDGFIQIHVSKPLPLTLISTSKKVKVSCTFSTVNFMLLCWEFKIVKNSEQELSLSKIAKHHRHNASIFWGETENRVERYCTQNAPEKS